jgi:hypothetical protein
MVRLCAAFSTSPPLAKPPGTPSPSTYWPRPDRLRLRGLGVFSPMNK